MAEIDSIPHATFWDIGTPTRACRRCERVLPMSEFPLHRNGTRMTRRTLCRACRLAYTNQWKEKNPARVKKHARRKKLKSLYGLTETEYSDMVRRQGGLCAICRQAETVRGRWGNVQPLAIDHDHATGKVRGLLCDRCNRGIGFFFDDIGRLRSAIAYLETVP